MALLWFSAMELLLFLEMSYLWFLNLAMMLFWFPATELLLFLEMLHLWFLHLAWCQLKLFP